MRNSAELLALLDMVDLDMVEPSADGYPVGEDRNFYVALTPKGLVIAMILGQGVWASDRAEQMADATGWHVDFLRGFLSDDDGSPLDFSLEAVREIAAGRGPDFLAAFDQLIGLCMAGDFTALLTESDRA